MSNRLVLLIGVIVGLWWFTRERDKTDVPQVETIQKPIATQAPRGTHPPAAVVVQRPVSTQAPAMRVVEKPRLPPEPFAGPMELVHFKVEDGLAVAFGDLILGRPVSDQPITQGFNKPPRPEPWKTSDIPYIIHPDLKNHDRIEMALAHLREKTVVNFVPFKGEKDAIVFEPGEANCKSYLGRVGGHQPIKLADQCGWVEVLHEIMHALGFVHEHSRTDRDRYIEVQWDNVQDEFKPQFAMVTEDLMEPLKGFEFDYRSVMLYPPNLFAKRTHEVTLKTKGQNPIDPSMAGLSEQDIERINKLFK